MREREIDGLIQSNQRGALRPKNGGRRVELAIELAIILHSIINAAVLLPAQAT